MIYALAPSPLDINRIWAGTDDGLIWLTTDGGANWNNITPPQLSAWQKVSVMEASHFDPQTAYAAINTLRLDDLRPHIYRTRDGGKTWTEITSGIPENENVNAVREDPKRKGLLFAGTERAVYVSFDDGDHWQSLRLNMPATSVRDLDSSRTMIWPSQRTAVDSGFSTTSLRCGNLSDKILASNAFLFAPETALRVRWNTNPDTPLPPDTPAGQNPPDGAILNYYLKSASSAPVTLEILDSSGKLVRRFSTADPVPQLNPDLDIPAYWLRPPHPLASNAGFHRFFWDMHYSPVPGIEAGVPDRRGALEHRYRRRLRPGSCPARTPWFSRLKDKKYTQPLDVKMDPRVKTSTADLQKQFDLSQQVYQDLLALQPVIDKVTAARAQLKTMREKASSADAARIDEAGKELESLEGGGGRRRRGRASSRKTSPACATSLLEMLTMLQEVDAAPTTQATAAVPKLHESADVVDAAQWQKYGRSCWRRSTFNREISAQNGRISQHVSDSRMALVSNVKPA